MPIRRVWSAISSRLKFMQGRQTRWHLHQLPVPTLAVAGLPPELASCFSKHVYALLAEPSQALTSLLLHSIKQGLERPLVWISLRSGQEMLELLEQQGINLDDEQTKKQLTLFSLKLPEHHHSRHDVGRLLLELYRYHLPGNGLLLFEGGESLLDWDAPASLKQEVRWLDDWAEQHQGRVLWVIAPDEAGVRSAAVHRMQQFLGGIVQLQSGRGELTWKMDLWETPAGVRLGETYPLRFTHEGQLALLKAGESEGLLLALDEQRVLALPGVVAGERWVPEHWEIVDGLEQLPEACTDAVAATVLIDCRGMEHIEALLRTVYQLRSHCGNKLKIVVREVGQPVRYQYESLLLTVGANQVIGSTVSFSRFLSLVQAVQGQQLARQLPSDFDAAVASLLESDLSGYLAPERFVNAVKDYMERSRQTGIVCALIKLALWPQVAHVDALNACRLSRSGDICSADERNIYLFLFACQVPDIGAVLERVFSTPLDILFEGEVLLVDEASIENFVEDFARRIVDTPPADYSAVLQQTLRPEAPQVEHAASMAAAQSEPERRAMPIGAPSYDPADKVRSVTPCSLPLKGEGACDD